MLDDADSSEPDGSPDQVVAQSDGMRPRPGFRLADAFQRQVDTISAVENRAAIVENSINKAMLAYTARSGLVARIAELAEMQSAAFNLQAGIGAHMATMTMADSLKAVSASALQISSWYEPLNLVSKNAFPGISLRLFDALQNVDLGILQQFTSSILPLTALPPLNLPDWEPPNWIALQNNEYEAALKVLNDGIPVVWVPRASIARKLVNAADADARDEVLLASRDSIADDCMDVLAEITSSELRPLADLAASAVGALRSGYGAAAQALAANIFDTWLREAASRGVLFSVPIPERGFYGHVRRQIGPVTEETAVWEFRATCVLAPALPALKPFLPSDPPPARYGRHPTSHRAGPTQYTDVNAIIAVMLAVSVLREAEFSGW